MRFDTSAIKESTDLLDLIGCDVALRRVSGDEYAGPCPRCGGRDRFHCTATWWFCRQCRPERGDAIAYVEWRDDLSFVEACELLGDSRGTYGPPHREMQVFAGSQPRKWPPVAPVARERAEMRENAQPSDAWQERARAFVAYAQGELWKSPQALEYLHDRGLVDETIQRARLGWNPREVRDTPDRWGIDPKDAKRGVKLRVGWVLPCEAGGVLWYVKIRRTGADISAAVAWNAAHPSARFPAGGAGARPVLPQSDASCPAALQGELVPIRVTGRDPHGRQRHLQGGR